MKIFLMFCFAMHAMVNRCLCEPQCSKFHYEEKLLEKMIRQEILVEAMKNEIEISQIKTAKTLDEVQKERNVWEENLLVMTDKISADLAAAVKESQEKVQEELKSLKREKEKWETQFRESVRIPEVVLFSARNPKATSLTKGLIMIFNAVLFNEGDAYNKNNGVFTAPYAGVYSFSVQLCVFPSKYVDFAFLANDKPFKQVRIQKHTTSWFSCYNFDAVTMVDKNDQVTILQESIGHYWNMFSGHLIYTS